MAEREIKKRIKLDNVQNDRNDPVVRQFLTLADESENDEDRNDMMDEVRENRDLKDNFFRLLERGTGLKRTKDTFLLQTSRRYTEEGKDIPKPFAKSRKSQESMGYIAEAIQEREYEHSHFFKVVSNMFDAEKTDGTSFLHIGRIGKKLSIQRREIANVRYDPRTTDFNAPPESDSSSNWLIIDFKYSYRDALRIAKEMNGEDWDGRLMPGSAINADSKWGNSTDKHKRGKDTEEGDVVFHHCYDIPSDTYMVFAGRGASIVQKPIAIPFRPKNIRGFRGARFPLVAFDFSAEKKGGVALSLYGAIKDITDPYRDFFDRVFVQLKLQINPYVFLFSDAGDSVIEQMKNATTMNDLGSLPLVLAPGGDKTRLEHITTNTNPVDFLRQLREMILDAVAERLGLNIRRSENVKEPLGTFERKNQFDNLAIAQHNEINELAFSMVADYVVDMHVTYSLGNTKEKITVNFMDEDGNTSTMEINYGTAVTVLRDWDGHFMVDTNIKVPITNQEKLESIKIINDTMRLDSAEAVIRTPEMAKIRVEFLWEILRRADLEERIKREDIFKFYKSMVDTFQQQIQAQAQAQATTAVAAGPSVPKAPASAPTA